MWPCAMTHRVPHSPFGAESGLCASGRAVVSSVVSEPFSLLSIRQTPFGTLAAVSLPAGLHPVAQLVLQRLDAETQSLALALSGRRQIEFTGGRLAFLHAMQSLGRAPECLRSGERREPLPPAGLTVSISHKEDLALCLVGDASLGCIGIDLEGDGRNRMRIASRVLREEELKLVEALPETEQWPRVLTAFAVKEATYKAIHPFLKRFVGFDEARVDFDSARQARVTLFTRPEEPTLTLETTLEFFEERVLAMVRCRAAST